MQDGCRLTTAGSELLGAIIFKMTTENEILEFWNKQTFPEKLREHCKAVETAALEITNNLVKKGVDVDLDLVKTGALLSKNCYPI